MVGWFYRLFRSVDTFAAGLLAVFGMANVAAILGSTAMLATALDVAHEVVGVWRCGSHRPTAVCRVWGVAGLYFGFWLISMAGSWCARGWLPRSLGLILMAGGAGYVLSTFVSYVFANADLGPI